MKTVALIPARSGSRGLPNKNIKMIAGKPLIAWSIEQAKASKSVGTVYVSTDCPKIAELSESYGAKVPFLRPKNLSSDIATTESVVDHFCKFLKQKELFYENVLLIQCTSPVRAPHRFDDAINYFNKKRFDSLISVAESHKFFWKNFENPTSSYDFKQRPRRQDIKERDKSFVETGSFYIFKAEKFFEENNRICGKYGLYLTPEDESFDIDSILDFSLCEIILNTKKKVKSFAA